MDYLKEILIASAQEAKDAGADIPDSIGFAFGNSHGLQAPLNGGVGGPSDAGPQGDYALNELFAWMHAILAE